ncbi:MAG TPA: hypothetical protein DCS43_11915 [Verrucomicrobia bacterium]|nr:hypothetical protein [Verrucomicrobiota bacterium]
MDGEGARNISILSGIIRAGVPLVLVERDGEFDWRVPSDVDSIRTLTLGTDNLAEIRRFWKGGSHRPASPWWPVLQTTVEWDTATGTYGLKRISLGFFGKRVWLFHEQRVEDDMYGTFGVEIKKEW